jgi:hypothetical protein
VGSEKGPCMAICTHSLPRGPLGAVLCREISWRRERLPPLREAVVLRVFSQLDDILLALPPRIVQVNALLAWLSLIRRHRYQEED